MRFSHLPTVREYAERFSGRTVDLGTLQAEHHPTDVLERSDHDFSPADFGHDQPSEVTFPDLIATGHAQTLDIVDEKDCVFVTEGDPDDPESIQAGYVELARLDGEAQRRMRGGRIAIVFQDPLKSLNPVYTVGNQIVEALKLHRDLKGRSARQEAAELLEAVGIPDAHRRVTEYPHQFSGGMRQRAVIAMALACEPEVLICDEPTTALDVTIQAQILDLLDDLQERRDLSIVFITHDMGVIADVSDAVNVMYAGEIVESAGVYSLFEDPKHPYTRGLLRSIPGQQAGDRLETIEGTVPTPTEHATYCRFAPRCPKAFDDCEVVHPTPVEPSTDSDDRDDGDGDRAVACLLYPENLEREEAVEYHRRRGESGGDSE